MANHVWFARSIHYLLTDWVTNSDQGFEFGLLYIEQKKKHIGKKWHLIFVPLQNSWKRLVFCLTIGDISYNHICKTKVRFYVSQNELKI